LGISESRKRAPVIITECLLQGFKGFAEPFTLHLKPGLNLVVGGNESGKSTLCEGILSALFAPPASSAFLNPSHPEVCRLLLCFSTPRGRFRIVKDFIRHSAALSTWDPAEAKFAPMTQDHSRIAELLTKELGGVSEAVFRTLCVLQPPPRLPTPLTPDSSPTAHSASGAIPSGNSQEKQKDRLQQLRGYLQTYRRIRETELLLDTLRTQYDETRASLQNLITLEEERRTTREALERYQPLASLATSSLLPQITEYRKALESRDGEVRELAAKLEEEQARLALIPSTPLFRQRLFLIGGGLLVLFLAADQFLPFVRAGIFLGLGCIAASLIQYLSWSQRRDKIRKGLLALEHQMNKGLELRLSRQFQSLLDLLPRTGCQDVSELVTRLQRRDALAEKLARLDQKFAELSAGTAPVDMEGKKKQLEEAIQVAEGELGSLGYVPEPADVQREIEEIERGALPPGKPMPVSRERPSQPVDTLLSTLERFLGGPSASVLSVIEAQASTLITAITAGRYTQIRRTPEDGLRLVLTGNQGERSLQEVSDGTQDQAMLAWHLALLTTTPQLSAVPLLLDDPFLRVDRERRKRLLPFLQSLARAHQIILFSHAAWIPSEAAHIVPLARANNRTPSAAVA
jgi:uncharacterized protein YhaN